MFCAVFLRVCTVKQALFQPKGKNVKGENVIMRKEYCYKAVLNDSYILYIGYAFGKYHVFCTDKDRTFNYSVYGGYKNIGTAENYLLRSANSYKSNEVSYFYMSKDLLHKIGPFAAQ